MTWKFGRRTWPLLARGSALLLAAEALAQQPDWVEVSGIPAQVSASKSFTVSIRGYGFDGFLATNWQGQVQLRSFAATPAMPVISECDISGETVEVTNPSLSPMDLSDWELQVLPDYRGISVPPNARLRIPAGTVLPPQSVLTWSSRGVPPGAFPAFVSAKPFNRPDAYRLVRMYNASGRILDEVYLGYFIYAPRDALWRGLGLGTYFVAGGTFQRLGDANHFCSSDWQTALPTAGTLNSALRLPWTHAGTWAPATPATVQITNGVWVGTVVLPLAAAQTNILQADDGAGVSGVSAPFQVVPIPRLVLEIPASLQPAFESQAGLAGWITVSVASPVAADLPVTLTLSDTNEFSLLPVVVIPTGSNSTTFAATNHDDAVADGLASVRLTASAPGYGDVTGTLFNADNESEGGWLFCLRRSRKTAGLRLSPVACF